ncbi:22530_t:CDS:2 [Entrophospora sp. SA101]|nr:22530_t:CDS:2 [Entrophospora sp. SA101]
MKIRLIMTKWFHFLVVEKNCENIIRMTNNDELQIFPDLVAK